MNRGALAALALLLAIIAWLIVPRPPGPQTVGGPEGVVLYRGQQWAVFRVVDRPEARLIVLPSNQR